MVCQQLLLGSGIDFLGVFRFAVWVYSWLLIAFFGFRLSHFRVQIFLVVFLLDSLGLRLGSGLPLPYVVVTFKLKLVCVFRVTVSLDDLPLATICWGLGFCHVCHLSLL